MATITYTDNGEQKTVPMWATESQMEALLKHFGASGGKEKMEKVTETLVERIKDLNEAVNELSDSNDELVDEIDDIADDITFKSRKNYTLNHLIERIKIYNEENFNYEVLQINFRG